MMIFLSLYETAVVSRDTNAAQGRSSYQRGQTRFHIIIQFIKTLSILHLQTCFLHFPYPLSTATKLVTVYDALLQEANS